ncbi:MAG: class I SAM-dependent methyltransferase [Desulfovibrio sp.]|nr:class I SAM-dependent methyltransferase [Desulfovibrio sp.]MDY5487012.1 class I SAM-dependent methyltransferase [Desulfovibrio sp.]
MGLLKTFFNNTGKPAGFLGQIMLWSMNWGHAPVADWGMRFISGLRPEQIVDIGCGGGRNAAELLRRFPRSSLIAVDYAEESVAKTRKVNREAVRAGRCEALVADVSSLPLPSDHFDLATAFETVYFWPDPVENFREVRRVLRPGGTFLIVNEADGTIPRDARWTDIIDGLKIYNGDQLIGFLREAGFTAYRAERDLKKHRLCVIAEK